jgi:hypothetical protein
MVARGEIWLARLDPTEGMKFEKRGRVWSFLLQTFTITFR